MTSEGLYIEAAKWGRYGNGMNTISLDCFFRCFSNPGRVCHFKRQPLLGRGVVPEDLAGVAALLASSASR